MIERIGHYRIVAELGRGGMGVVYKAHEESLNRFVALKVLGDHLAEDPTAVQRFEREAQSAARLNHPNIVQIYTISEDAGRHYFAMEYVTGASLQRVMRERGQLPVAEAVRLVLQAAVGLAAAHDQGVIHRDIKPANLMLDERGLVKIADFGLALLAESASRLTATGMFMGTPGYLSPEQCLDAEVDHRTDIYSLGITFYEALAGRAPFKADSPLALLKQILEVEPPDVGALRPEVDQTLRGVLSRMIAKDRDARYADCHALIDDLEGWLKAHGEPASGLAALAASVRQPHADGAATSARELNTRPTVQASSAELAVESGRTVATPAAGATPPSPPAGTAAAIAGTGQPTAEPAPMPPAAASPQRRDTVAVVAILVMCLLGVLAAAGLGWHYGLFDRFLGGDRSSPQAAARLPGAPAGAEAPMAHGPQSGGGEVAAGTTSVTPDEPAAGPGSDSGGERESGPAVPAGATALEPPPARSVDARRSTSPAREGAAALTPASGSRAEPVAPPLPTGVAVVAVGEPLLAGEAARALESRLAAAGVELVDPYGVPAAARLLSGEPDPDALCAALGGEARAVVMVRAEVLAVRPLQYMGRYEDAYQARLAVTALDTRTCAPAAPGWSDRVEYTALNVGKKAEEAVRTAARGLSERLASR